MKDEGDFRTFDEAQRSADSRNRCAPGDADCEKRRNVCAGGTVAAIWAVACDANDRMAPPVDSEARRLLESSGAAMTTSAKVVDETETMLTTFARTRTIRERGAARAAAAVDALRAARNRLRNLRAEQESLLTRVTSAADARAFSERANVAVKSAADAVAAVTAMTTDPGIVDTTAEDREKRIAAALRAREDEDAKRKAAREADEAKRKAAREAEEARRATVIAAMQEDGRRRAEELESRRKEAEAARVAAAEASQKKLEEQRAQQQANSTASDAEKKRITEQKHGAVAKSLGDVDALLTGALVSVAATLAVANAPRDQRARAQANDQRLRNLQARAKEVRARADAAIQRGPADALAAISRAEVELAMLAAEARGATAAPTAVPAAASTNGREPAPVPSCVVDLLPPAGLDGATVALDGGKGVPLPAKVRLSSGRHAFVVSHGKRTMRQSELVVCGRVASFALNPPK